MKREHIGVIMAVVFIPQLMSRSFTCKHLNMEKLLVDLTLSSLQTFMAKTDKTLLSAREGQTESYSLCNQPLSNH